MDFWTFQIPAAAALTVVAVLGYLLGRRRRSVDKQTTFGRTGKDPHGIVNDRRGLDDVLVAQFATMSRYDSGFSLAIFAVDRFEESEESADRPGRSHDDQNQRDLAEVLGEMVRETDVVARYGRRGFAILMRHADLEESCIFSERLRAEVQRRVTSTVSGGVTAALDGDNRESLLARAEEALCHAKTAGGNCVFRHTGEQIEPVLEEISSATG